MTEKVDREIYRFFGEEVLPLGVQMKSGNVELLATRLTQGDASYFVRRSNTAMTKSDFEAGGCASVETVEADLARAWNRADSASLLALAPGIAGLARTLRQVDQQSGEVSEFVYAMY